MNEKQYGTEPVKKIFFKAVIPSVFAGVFGSIGMIIDGIFVGNYVGSSALAAINIVMPIFMIIFALSDMLAAGSSVRVSMAMGKEKYKEAKEIFSVSILMTSMLGVIFLILGFLFGRDIINFFIRDAVLAELSYEYTIPFIVLLPIIMIFFMSDNFLRVCGKVKLSMWINILTTIMNIFLDWFLIGQLNLGIKAAAYATAVSMSLGSCVSLVPFLLKKTGLRFSKPKISKSVLIDIIYNGSSVFFGSIASSLMAIVINGFLINLGGASAVSAASIVVYINELFTVVVMAISDSLQPVISYNAGLENKERIVKVVKLSCITAFLSAVVCMFTLIIFKTELVEIFINASEMEVIDLTKIAINLSLPSYLFSWFNIIAGSLMTSLDMPKESFIIMIFNSVIFPLAVLIICTSFMGVYGVFITETIVEVLTFVLCFKIMYKLEYRAIGN